MDSRFQVIRELGSGGQAKVFLAEDLVKGGQIVLKQTPYNHESADRVLHEFQVLSKIDHPHLLRVLDFGTTPDEQHLFWTTEYLPGQPLDAVRGLTFKEKTDYFVETLRALQFLHRQGLLHLDIKPANLFLTDQGSLKLLDFGLSALGGKLKGGGGTLAYASPEQIMGGVVDSRSDLYSLGITFYEIFTGRHPFKAKTVSEWVLHHLQTRPRPPSEIARALAPIWDGVFLKLTAKNKKDRFQNAAEVIEAINEFAEFPYPVERAFGWKGYAATKRIGELEGEMTLALGAIERLKAEGGGLRQVVCLKNFPPEGIKMFLDQLYFILKGDRQSAYNIPAGEDWIVSSVKLWGEKVAGSREEIEANFFHHLLGLLQKGPVYFLFESDFFAEERYKALLNKMRSMNLAPRIIFIGPFSLWGEGRDEGERIPIPWNPDTKGDFVPLPLESLSAEQIKILERLAVAHGGLNVKKLSQSVSLEITQVIDILSPLIHRQMVVLGPDGFCLQNLNLIEALLSRMDRPKKISLLEECLQLKPEASVRARLLLELGKKEEARPLLLNTLQDCLDSSSFSGMDRFIPLLAEYEGDPQLLRLQIRLAIFFGDYRQAAEIAGRLDSLPIGLTFQMENKRRRGWLKLKNGDLQGASQSYEQAYTLAKQVNNIDEIGSLANEIGYLKFKMGDVQGAAVFFEEHRQEREAVKSQLIVSNDRYDVVLAANGQMEQAWNFFEKKKDKIGKNRDPQVRVNFFLTAAYLHHVGSEEKKAYACYRQALQWCRENKLYGPQEGIMENLKNVDQLLKKTGEAMESSVREEDHKGGGDYTRLFEVLEDMHSETEEQALLEKVVDYGIELTGGMRGFLLMKKEMEEGMPKFEIRVSRYFEGEAPSEAPISYTFLRKVFQQGKPMITVNALSDKELQAMESVLKFNLRSIVCVPLKLKNNNMGVLYIDHPIEEGFFGENQLAILGILGRQAAVALHKMAFLNKLKRNRDEVNQKLDAINSNNALFHPFNPTFTWEDYEAKLIKQLVKLHGGKKSSAAKKLDLSRTTLNKKLARAG